MKRLFLATLSLIVLTSCTCKAQLGSTNDLPTANVEASSEPAPLDGWSLSVGKPENKGRTFTMSESFKQEAVDTWTVVPITIKNTSGKRRKGDDAFHALLSFGLVDSKGKVYEPGSLSLFYGDDLSTPFDVNESRKNVFMFDTPKNIKPSHLITDRYEPSTAKVIKF